MSLPAFHFKKFKVEQDGAAHPVGTDAVLLGAWVNLRDSGRFLDIGTGTGVIALMLAQRMAESGITTWNGSAVEIHPDSAALAKRNFAESHWPDRLSLWEGAVQQFVQVAENQYDLIVCNPPFFSELTVSPNKIRSLGRHTETLSFTDLLSAVNGLLTLKGRFCIILPEQEGHLFCELAVTQGLYWTRITEVKSRLHKPVERLLLQFEKSPYAIERREMRLFQLDKGDLYSEDFRALTKHFYLAG